MELTTELTKLFDTAVAANASDIHLVPGEQPALRIQGNLSRLTETPPLTVESLEELLLPLFSATIQASLRNGTLPTAETIVSHDKFSFVTYVYRSGGNLTSTIRILLSAVPEMEKVGGDSVSFFLEIAKQSSGLILISGPAGSGKVTTAFALLNEIVQNQPRRIYIIEESPAFRLSPGQGLVSSLMIGQDVPDYETATRLLYRGADPDVIYLGDMPTIETARQSLTLARTGHLVIANVTADSAAEAVVTLCRAAPDSFPELLAKYLIAVTNQRLFPGPNGKGRIPAYEILKNTPAIVQLLQESADADAFTLALESGASDGMRSLAQAIAIVSPSAP